MNSLWPRTAPAEWRWWTRINAVLLAAFIIGGVLTNSRIVGVTFCVVTGFVQVLFGLLLALDHSHLATRLAQYFRDRPILLGGFWLNRLPAVNRMQGALMVVAGAVVIIAAYLWAKS